MTAAWIASVDQGIRTFPGTSDTEIIWLLSSIPAATHPHVSQRHNETVGGSVGDMCYHGEPTTSPKLIYLRKTRVRQ